LKGKEMIREIGGYPILGAQLYCKSLIRKTLPLWTKSAKMGDKRKGKITEKRGRIVK